MVPAIGLQGNLMPPLTKGEFADLTENIRRHGVREPIVVDETGVILDGHHRWLACLQLEIDCPQRVVEGLSDDEKLAYAIEQNVYRRQLTRPQRKQLVLALDGHGLSVREISRATGFPKSNVHRWLQQGQEGLFDEPVPDGTSRQRAELAEPADRLTTRIRALAKATSQWQPEVFAAQVLSESAYGRLYEWLGAVCDALQPSRR